MKKSFAALLGAVIGGVVFTHSAGVLAEEQPGTAERSPNSHPKTSKADQADSADIPEIVITAQRRAENVQKSSLKIDVVTGEALVKAGVSQAGDLTRLVAGLQLAQVGPTAQPYIRGVGNASNTGSADSGVAFNVDGIYVGQPVAYGLDFYDLARIEVLKGPQGTLYGRNATGGAINLISNEPRSEFGGYVTAEYGNYDNKRLTGALNIPITRDLYVRGAFNIVDRDGYFDNGTGDDVQQAGRLRVKYAPDGLTNLLNLEYGHVGGVGGGAAIVDGNLDGNPANGLEYNLVNTWQGVTSPANLAKNYVPSRNTSAPQFNDIKSFMASDQLDVDLGSDTTLTLLPAYRSVSQRSTSYNGGFLFGVDPYRWQQFSTEARVSHVSSRLKWVVGAYYFHQKFTGLGPVDLQILPPGFLPPGIGTGILLNVAQQLHTESYSLFGEATYEIASGIRLIGGLRYTDDKSSGNGTQTYYEQPLAPCSAAAPCLTSFDAHTSATNVSWKVGAEYDVGPRSMLYATVATGFKAGGVFAANAPRNNYNPEKLLAFELGSRNRFLDNRLQVNLEAFYWDYKDKQETFGGFDSCGGAVCPAPLPPGTFTNLTLNAGSARVYGGSLDVVLKVTPTTTMHGVVEYAESRYTNFSYSAPQVPITGCAVSPPSGPGAAFTVDCSGMPLTRAPKWSATAEIDKVFPIRYGELILSGNVIYNSSRYLDAHFLGNNLAPSYALVGTDLTYTSLDDKFSLTLYAKNIFNTAAATTGSSMAESASPFVATAILQAPRTYGIRANFNF